jgi:ribosome-associated protein
LKEPVTSASTTKDTSLQDALEAALDKKAVDVIVLELDGVCSFTDCFIICSGTSSRQNQAISDGVKERLRQSGHRASHIEGYAEGEWILMDYLDFVVHIFTERAREFYDLERLWRAGKRRNAEELIKESAL